jgi:hypothetical protein
MYSLEVQQRILQCATGTSKILVRVIRVIAYLWSLKILVSVRVSVRVIAYTWSLYSSGVEIASKCEGGGRSVARRGMLFI